ncbi:MAG: hypothetical protein AAF125_08270 [Chloroflexota bacterium]
MSNIPTPPDENPQEQPQTPKWMDELQDHADHVLGDLDMESACDQVHPIIASWYDDELEREPPDSRPAVWQAVACLATEIIMDAEQDDVLGPLVAELDEDAISMWVEHILVVGRAMQISLDNGELDDL